MPKKTGILLVNLGSPADSTVPAIRRYLRDFLQDKRVVELPRLFWLPLLYGIISVIRPYKIVSAYKAIWSAAGSPIRVIAKEQALCLHSLLCSRGFLDCAVESAMVYGEPSLEAKLEAFTRQGVETLIVLPLYPQYSGTSTGAVFDKVAKVLMTWRALPRLHFINAYYQEPAYIAALAASIKRHWQANGRGGRLIFSFHGIPKRCCEKGDPYFEQCHETVALTCQALAIPRKEAHLAFQSRFGSSRWLEPNLLDALAESAGVGVRRADVICPGFAADCLETLEEVEIRARAFFFAKGGETFYYIPALNAQSEHMQALFCLVERFL